MGELADDKVICYNLVTSAVSLLSRSEVEMIRDPSTCTKPFLREALEAGFLIPSDENEVEKVLAVQRMNNFSTRFAGFQLLPTTACNARCWYCYEEGFIKETMSDDVVTAIPDFLESYMGMVDDFHITWFGGEPLMGLDIMRRLSREVIDRCDKHDIGYTSDIITNATLLTSDVARIIHEECHVSQAQITLDGMGSNHVARKRYVDPSITFEDIIDAMETLVNLGVRLLIRLNVDKENLDDCLELIDRLGKLWARNKNVMLYAAPLYGNRGNDKLLSRDDLDPVYDRVFRRMIDSGWIQTLDGLPMNFNNATCSARMINNFVINPKGDVYKCEHLLSRADERIGTVFDGVIFNDAMVHWTLPSLPEKCLECSYLPACQGGCYAAGAMDFGFERCPHIAFITEAITSAAGYLLSKCEREEEL